MDKSYIEEFYNISQPRLKNNSIKLGRIMAVEGGFNIQLMFRNSEVILKLVSFSLFEYLFIFTLISSFDHSFILPYSCRSKCSKLSQTLFII